MADFDLSQALDCPDDLGVTGSESSFSDGTEEEVIKLDDGLELLVLRDRTTLKGVVSLVLAVNRMKKPPICCSNDDELCNAIMDSLVEETIVNMVVNCNRQKRFIRLNSEKEFTLCDRSQKALIYKSVGDLKLQAVTLKGGQGGKVYFKLSKYIPTVKGPDLTVVLSIKTTKLHISCSMKDDKALLKLEECSEDNLREICDENMERFLFYKRKTGDISLNKFESVKCPGWYISTSSDRENEAVEMCKENTSCRLISFHLG